MDPLSDILELVGVKSSIYFQKDFCGPWKMSVDNTGFAQFHFIIRGGAIVDSDGEQIMLSAGDIVVFPAGARHTIGDHPASTAIPGKNVIADLQNGQEPFTEGPFATTMICGHFEYELAHPHPMIRHLPIRIILRTTDLPVGNALLGLLPIIVHETRATPLGSRIIVQHLSHALFTLVLRAYFESIDADIGPYAGLRDERILSALSAIHEPRGWSYSLVDLAQRAGMSRSSFSATFKSLIGQSPGEYAIHWKLLKAKRDLKHGQAPVEKIAFDYGYSTASAFSRAFRGQLGVSPSCVRTPGVKRDY